MKSTQQPADTSFVTYPQTSTWRVRRSNRIAAAVFLPGVFSGVAIDAVLLQRTEPYWIGALLIAVGLAGVWLFAFRPRLTLDGTEVLVRNPLRAVRFDLGEVLAVEPGYSGVEFHLRSGRTVRAWAVQKANAAWMLGRETRADVVAASFNERASGRDDKG